MNFVLCDDDVAYSLTVRHLLKCEIIRHDINATVTFYADPDKLLEDLKAGKIVMDALFLDIELGNFNGVDFARRLRCENINAVIIFLTGHSDYLQKGYETKAFRYVFKHQFAELIPKLFPEIIKELKDKSDSPKICIRAGKNDVFLDVENILYIESKFRMLHIYCGEREYSFYGTLEGMKKILPENMFMKPHMSYIINVKQVKLINKNNIIMKNLSIVPVSRNNRAKVMASILKKSTYQGKDCHV